MLNINSVPEFVHYHNKPYIDISDPPLIEYRVLRVSNVSLGLLDLLTPWGTVYKNVPQWGTDSGGDGWSLI